MHGAFIYNDVWNKTTKKWFAIVVDFKALITRGNSTCKLNQKRKVPERWSYQDRKKEDDVSHQGRRRGSVVGALTAIGQ